MSENDEIASNENIDGEIIGDEIDVIASGYEWLCPYCSNMNKLYEAREKAYCSGCGKLFKLASPEHAEEYKDER
jgi:uncharacterized Zn-finger protein